MKATLEFVIAVLAVAALGAVALIAPCVCSQADAIVTDEYVDGTEPELQPLTEEEFVDLQARLRITPQPDPISTPGAAPAPTPHASCRCTACKCTPVCVGACSIPQPAGDATAPIANSTPAASAAPATSGAASSCPGGQCSVRSAPVRRGIFGWRR